jgi:hypothetical protein
MSLGWFRSPYTDIAISGEVLRGQNRAGNYPIRNDCRLEDKYVFSNCVD